METFIIKDQGKGIIESLDPNKVVSIGSLGKNVASNYLTSKQGAGLELGAPWSIVTAGQPLSITGLADKSADSTFDKLLVQNSLGQNSTKSGWSVMVNSMQKSTDLEKDAWRLASRKTGETYSLGQPRVDFFLPTIIDKSLDEAQSVSLIGLNLFLNNSTPSTASVTLCRVKDELGNIIVPNSEGIYPTEYLIDNVEVHQSTPTILSIRPNFYTYSAGSYSAKVLHNGITNILDVDSCVLLITDVVTQNPITITSYNMITFNSAGNTDIISTINNPNIYLATNEAEKDQFIISEQPIATLAELQNGILLKLKLVISSRYGSYGGDSGSCMFILTTNSTNDKNQIGDLKIYKNDQIISSYPSHKTLATVNRLPIDSDCYILIKNNLIKIILPQENYFSITNYIPSGDLYIKGLLTRFIDAYAQGGGQLSIYPITKYNI